MTEPKQKKWRAGDLALLHYPQTPMIMVIRIVRVATKSVSFTFISEHAANRLFDPHRAFNEHLYPMAEAATLAARIAQEESGAAKTTAEGERV